MKKIQDATSKDNAEKLNSESHFELLHGGHKAMIGLSTKKKTKRSWKDRVYHHDDALENVRSLVPDADRNIYISQSGFNRKEGRSVQNVAVLPVIFVDIDNYKVPELADKTPEEVLEIILEDSPWMPRPTLLASSGRGVYLIWILEEPLGQEDLPNWQAVEKLLVGKLKSHGADQQVTDAARVLRICDSTNLESGKTVTYTKVGKKIPFAEIQKAVLESLSKKEKAEEKPPRPKLVSTNPDIKTKPVISKQIAISGDVITLYNEYSLAYARMQDLRRVAKMRTPLTDYRKRFLFCFAVAVAWYCPTQEDMERELLYFIQNFFDEPDKYDVQNVQNVIEKVGAKRYRIRNKTIMNILDITQYEQYTLKTLISPHHVYQRQLKKRREEGVRPQAEYLAQQSAERKAKSEDRKRRAKAMREQGFKRREIAKELGITIRSVARLLSS